MRPMAKHPSKRGGSRGKSASPSGAAPSKSRGPAKGGAPGAKPGGPKHKAAQRPGWMPEPPRHGGPKAPARAAPNRDPNAAREAARYDQPIASREMLLRILEANEGPMDAEALSIKLALTEPDRFDALTKRLGAMVRDGQLLQNRKGAYAPAERLDLIPGVVIANPEGFGFLRPEKGQGDDLFLPPNEMRKVMHGDRVLANVTGMDRRGRREGSDRRACSSAA
jgi:ribonuclease R